MVNFYRSIEDCVNTWLEQHPEAELLDSKFTTDYTFFKGTLYEAILTIETPVRIADDFNCLKRNEATKVLWDKIQKERETVFDKP
jgi:hypothetical protein